jgi:hypothetical protein
MLHFYGCPACKAPLAMASTLLRYAVIQSGQCPLCGCRFRTMTPLRLTLVARPGASMLTADDRDRERLEKLRAIRAETQRLLDSLTEQRARADEKYRRLGGMIEGLEKFVAFSVGVDA